VGRTGPEVLACTSVALFRQCEAGLKTPAGKPNRLVQYPSLCPWSVQLLLNTTAPHRRLTAILPTPQPTNQPTNLPTYLPAYLPPYLPVAIDLPTYILTYLPNLILTSLANPLPHYLGASPPTHPPTTHPPTHPPSLPPSPPSPTPTHPPKDNTATSFKRGPRKQQQQAPCDTHTHTLCIKWWVHARAIHQGL
jgi:hypothetical protein